MISVPCVLVLDRLVIILAADVIHKLFLARTKCGGKLNLIIIIHVR